MNPTPRARLRLALTGVLLGMLVCLCVLWLLPVELPAGTFGQIKLRIRYGAFGWYVLDTGSVVRPPSRPWPWTPGWQGAVQWGSLLWTLAATGGVGLAAWAVALRIRRSFLPRSRCRQCGQILRGGFRDSPLCPECGRLPHAS